MAKYRISDLTDIGTPDASDKLEILDVSTGESKSVLVSNIGGTPTESDIATINHNATEKTTIVDADEVTGQDSANSFSLIRMTFTSIWTWIKTKLTETYQSKTVATYTFALSDANTVIENGYIGGTSTYTLPLNTSVAFPLGSKITILYTVSNGSTFTISPDIGVTTISPNGLSLRYKGYIILTKLDVDKWYVLASPTGFSISGAEITTGNSIRSTNRIYANLGVTGQTASSSSGIYGEGSAISTGNVIESKLLTGGTGKLYSGKNNTTETFSVTKNGDVTANKYIKTGGLSTEYLMADGSVTIGGGGGATNLDDLTDVTITTPTTGQVLKYNGSIWVNDTDAGGGTNLTWNDATHTVESDTGTDAIIPVASGTNYGLSAFNFDSSASIVVTGNQFYAVVDMVAGEVLLSPIFTTGEFTVTYNNATGQVTFTSVSSAFNYPVILGQPEITQTTINGDYNWSFVRILSSTSTVIYQIDDINNSGNYPTSITGAFRITDI